MVQFSTMMLLALAANTSFGGLPVLARLLAKDNLVPHVFALRAERQVHRYGVGVLAIVSAVLLLVARGDMNTLVPLFAIGVFVGFTLSQVGMVRHWLADRPKGWQGKVAINGFGAALTFAAIVVTATKFTEGAWLIVLILPLLMLLMLAMSKVSKTYDELGARRGLGELPPPPVRRDHLVVVPVLGVDRMTSEAVSAAKALSDQVVAVHVVDPDDPSDGKDLQGGWERWDPGVPLTLLETDRHLRLAEPIIGYLERQGCDQPVVVLPEVEPAHAWQRMLQNQRGAILDRALRKRTNAIVCRLRFGTHRFGFERMSSQA